MMGQSIVQDRLFYAFDLEGRVPRDHLLRGVDRFLDLGELRQHLAPRYSHTGRPTAPPLHFSAARSGNTHSRHQADLRLDQTFPSS
jgi:hypothetical protein